MIWSGGLCDWLLSTEAGKLQADDHQHFVQSLATGLKFRVNMSGSPLYRRKLASDRPPLMPRFIDSFIVVTLKRQLVPIAALMAIGATVVGCEKPDRLEISESRKRFTGETDPEFGLTAEQRFLKEGAATGGDGMAGQAEGPPTNPFRWVVPEGWGEKASSRMRLINLSFGPNAEGECYLTALPGEAGGIPMNVNRWRGQMGLEPLSEEEMSTLPEKPLLGMAAKFVDFRGDFGGMSLPGAPAAEKKTDYRMLGLIQQQPPFTFFVKMTGPADIVAANEEAFYSFCQSITIGAH